LVGLIRFDVADANGSLFVVIETELLPPDKAVVVIPLIADYPAARHLNPVLDLDGRRMVLATRLIASVRRSALRRVGNVSDQGDQITRAVDFLMGGV
jgi:toxin CcdB